MTDSDVGVETEISPVRTGLVLFAMGLLWAVVSATAYTRILLEVGVWELGEPMGAPIYLGYLAVLLGVWAGAAYRVRGKVALSPVDLSGGSS